MEMLHSGEKGTVHFMKLFPFAFSLGFNLLHSTCIHYGCEMEEEGMAINAFGSWDKGLQRCKEGKPFLDQR